MHNAVAQTISITHLLGDGGEVESYEVTLTYASESSWTRWRPRLDCD